MSSNPCNCMDYRGGPSNNRVSRPERRMAVWLQVNVHGCGLSLQPVGCVPTLSVTQKRCCGFSCILWLCVICLCLLMFHWSAIAYW